MELTISINFNPCFFNLDHNFKYPHLTLIELSFFNLTTSPPLPIPRQTNLISMKPYTIDKITF